MKLKTKLSKGFTLIELLVVIAIIAVLAALSTPAIIGALNKAKIAKSKGVCQAFEVAVNNFENEYNYLPYDGGGNAPDSDLLEQQSNDGLMSILAGREDQINFKQIKFFQQPNAKAKKDGMLITGNNVELFDPWGQKYYVSMDYDLDDELPDPFGGSDIQGKKVLIWSKGADNLAGDIKKNRDNASNF